MRDIQQAVHELRLDPRPVKVLVIDELHTQAEILKTLLAAAGNADSRGSTLNFDGIIIETSHERFHDKPDKPASLTSSCYVWKWDPATPTTPLNSLSALS
ncbi:MAG: hypothetical protein R3B54_07285 [Bdellovibrionota bacterium]